MKLYAAYKIHTKIGVCIKVRKRERSTAIIDTKKGIILVRIFGPDFSFPGGGVEKGETPEEALIREVKEELSIDVVSSKYLFDVLGVVYKNKSGKLVQNKHHVFLVKTLGVPKIRKNSNEIKEMIYFRSNSEISLSESSKRILANYGKMS